MPELLDRINNYLQTGGLFNPELMEHVKVRDLLMDLRNYLRTEPTAMRMFDELTMRAANHYHGIPEIDKRMQKESQLILEWSLEALRVVDPTSHESVKVHYERS